MAWIESHQTLSSHPKTRRAARQLGISIPQMMGHLHLVWHWALDHAEDGDLSRYDADDLAIAAQWEDDPDLFVDALVNCGPGGGSGFIDRTGRRFSLHNWAVYTDRLVARRESGRKANHERWHVARGVRAEGCDWCEESEPDASAVPTESDRNPTGVGSESTVPNPTQPNPTQPKNTTSDLRPAVSDDATDLTREFAQAVKANGHPIPKPDSAQADTWLTEMDRLLRIGPPGWDGDPPEPDEVRTVIRWATTDEFERANIQSVPKLRKRYSQLRLKALNTARASPGGKGNQYAARYREAAAELERQGR